MNYRPMLMTSSTPRMYPDDVVVVEPVAVEPVVVVADPTAAVESKVETEKPVDEKPLDLKAKEPTLLAEEPKAEDKKDEPAAVVVPETYEFKAPEGQTDLDPAMIEAATPVFKELGLSQEQGQKLVDLYAGKMLPEVAQTIQGQTLELLGLGDIAKWSEMTKTDKEIGGAKLAETMVHAAAGRDKFATPALRALLETSRMGNHPEVVRMFAAIGKSIGEGKVMGGDDPATVIDAGTKFYGDKYAPKS